MPTWKQLPRSIEALLDGLSEEKRKEAEEKIDELEEILEQAEKDKGEDNAG